MEQFAISLDPALAARVRVAAQEEGRSVSEWLADAAECKVRLIAGREALGEYERAEGAIAEEELAAARRAWPEPGSGPAVPNGVPEWPDGGGPGTV
jgi:hypothetical protein